MRLLLGRRLTALLTAAMLVSASTALAYFTGAAGHQTAAASVASMTAPGSPSATGSGASLQLTWTASTVAGSSAATSYTVERYSGTGTDLGSADCSPVQSSSGVPNAFGSFSCTDSPGTGTFKYQVTAHYHAAWTKTAGFTNSVTLSSLNISAPATGATSTTIPSSSIGSTLSGSTSGATGTITFKVFGPQASAPGSCASGGTTVGTATVSGPATYNPSAGYTPATQGTYWWYASYNGDANNGASNSTCGSGMTSTTVGNATASTATGPASGTAGTAIATSSISSALSGATTGAGGTITFTVFGPQASAPTSCASGGTTVGTATASGNGTYHPASPYTPQTAGTYWWYASYSGDGSNVASNSTCGSGMGSTTVVKTSPAASVSAPSSDPAATPIGAGSIGSTLSGATSGATGTITFKVFGPQASAPSSCASGGTTVGTATVSGPATYNPSAGYTPGTKGTYWWYASYNGDTGNNASNSTCGSGMTSTTVGKASPTITASAPGTAVKSTAIPAGSISSILGLATSGATGTVTFEVFGPQTSAPTTCTSGGHIVGTATVSGPGTYHPSAAYTPATDGTYWWYASYNGDTNNNASASFCGSGMTSMAVGNATATTATGPAGAAAGTAIATGSISSALSGATPGAGGTITFTVFGPQTTAPTSCTSGGTTVGTATVSGNGTYHPASSYTPQSVGTYWWYASYSGDTGDNASTSTCGTGMGSTAVGKASPTITASAPGTAATNAPIATGSISAALSSTSSGATGTITYKVFGPQTSAPTTCTSGGTTVGTAAVSGPATYNPSAGFTPTAPGSYWWYASYGGDTDDNSAAGTCGNSMPSTTVENATSLTISAPSTDTVNSAIAAGSIGSTLSGAASGAGGKITVTVFGPQTTAPTTCTSGGHAVGAQVTINGSGTYHPSAGYTPTTAGTYWWYASYNGDPNNGASSTTCGTGMTSTTVS